MSASKLCVHCWLEAVRLRLQELERDDFRGSAHDALRDAREAWYVGDLGIAEATRRAEEHIAQEIAWERESLETARGVRR